MFANMSLADEMAALPQKKNHVVAVDPVPDAAIQGMAEFKEHFVTVRVYDCLHKTLYEIRQEICASYIHPIIGLCQDHYNDPEVYGSSKDRNWGETGVAQIKWKYMEATAHKIAEDLYQYTKMMVLRYGNRAKDHANWYKKNWTRPDVSAKYPMQDKYCETITHTVCKALADPYEEMDYVVFSSPK